jgi:endonuclease/exonuclease/phosphatase family metal-dependent hydrolase
MTRQTWFRLPLAACVLGLVVAAPSFGAQPALRVVGAIEESGASTVVSCGAGIATNPLVAALPSGLQPPSAQPPGLTDITIATYNVHDMFDTVDDPAKTDPVVSSTLYNRMLGARADSIADHLGAPDIVCLQEVENQRVVRDLAAKVNACAGKLPDPLIANADYSGQLMEGLDSRGIDVAYLFRRERMRLLILDQHQAFPDGNPLYDRPPLVARFEVIATGSRLNLICNHFKSQIGGGAETREDMAKDNLALAHTLKRSEPDVPVFVLGDLNDHPDSVTLTTLTADGLLVDPHSDVPPADDYTYRYAGQNEVLDYILVEPATHWTEFHPLHINVDFAVKADDALIGECGPGSEHERASDHDPVLLRVPLDELPTPGAPAMSLYMPLALSRAVVGAPPRSSTATPTVAATTPTRVASPVATPRSPTPTRTSAPATATRTPTLPRPSDTPVATRTPTASGGTPPAWPLDITTIFYDGAGSNEPDEYVAFTNVTATTVDLAGWQLISVRGDQHYSFTSGSKIAAGETCRVYTNETHDEWCGFSYGSGTAIWRNDGDKAELRDGAGNLVDRYCYGDMESECRP